MAGWLAVACAQGRSLQCPSSVVGLIRMELAEPGAAEHRLGTHQVRCSGKM
jgi:hypothetical protein